MDSLALLCNLYGQGPVTLRRLRDAGCRTCDDVLCLEPTKLARALRTRRPAAERFQREARELAARIGEFGGPAPAIESHELPPEPESAASVAEPALEPELAALEEGDAQLRPELLDGLDSSLCLRLRSLGIERVEDLARADALELARSLEVPVTRVVRLQFLARRLADARVESEPELRTFTLLPRRSQLSAARFSPAEPQGEPQGELAPLPEEERMEAWAREQALEPVAVGAPAGSPAVIDGGAAGPFGAAEPAAEASAPESEAAGPFA